MGLGCFDSLKRKSPKLIGLLNRRNPAQKRFRWQKYNILYYKQIYSPINFL